ncbi:DUF1636 domain-containing protein [Paracoccus sp. MBLB3053]|uniref:DUF1636 domain-containing protein n=1 Tax=Paracoccus aurantius TaxID=3073814 RepID=A0ABU2HT61_9RHOB|nr:DUF1636 domain-containing protein [Paracoccus sp. MBLB3053]MDS9468236.1 DUF1636 domain-containing protein [Paracoccus sp. MBLB3053]
MTKNNAPVELLVCTKCRRADEVGGEERPGSILYRRLSESGIEAVKITPVECLSNCNRGCTIALRGPGRWTYIYGNLDEGVDLDMIREGTRKYLVTPDGLVAWRDRPEHFRKNCIARIPPMETA